jgi:hypothetical protein
MNLHDAIATVKYLIRDRDSRYTAADAVFADESFAIAKTGIRYLLRPEEMSSGWGLGLRSWSVAVGLPVVRPVGWRRVG